MAIIAFCRALDFTSDVSLLLKSKIFINTISDSGSSPPLCISSVYGYFSKL